MPVLALGVGSVKSGTDPLADGRGDVEGPGPHLGCDGAVSLPGKGKGLVLRLEEKESNFICATQFMQGNSMCFTLNQHSKTKA